MKHPPRAAVRGAFWRALWRGALPCAAGRGGRRRRLVSRPFGRAVALCAAVGLMLSLGGCASPPDPAPDAPPASAAEPAPPPATLAEYPLVLPWYRGEGYNPYLTDNSLTVQLADLLFEKLLVIDPAAQLEYRAVRAVHIEGLTVTLTVDASYRYADGTAVSAQDVAACLEAARASRLYKGRFANVERVTAGEGVVTVTLRQPDAYFAWLLDIPLMPAGQTAQQRPTASGRYTYAEDDDALVPNPCARQTAPFDRITLAEMTGADALPNSLNIGAISLYSSEGEGLANGINSSRQAGYYTNTLVFLGFNAVTRTTWQTTDEEGNTRFHSQPTGVCPLLETAAGRKAINALLDRTILLERVYYNWGHVAGGYLNSVGAAGGHGVLATAADPDAATAALQALGCTRELDGYYHLPPEKPAAARADTDPQPGEVIHLRLLVYTGSSYKRYLGQLVADALGDAGLQVELIECDTLESYRQKIASLEFDLYIGEIKLYHNMDLGAFFQPEGAAAGGLQLSEELTQLYDAWRADPALTAQLEAALADEMPWAPLLWRSGTLYYAKALEGFIPSASSVFYSMEEVRLSE